MAQSGFTPILIYGSTTTGNTPSASNLTTTSLGVELAINATDGKLFYKDNSGNVQTLATKATGTIGGSNTQVQYNSSGSLAGSANMVFDGSTLTTLNAAYTGTLTGGTGVVNLGSGQFYKDASGNVGIGTTSAAPLGGAAGIELTLKPAAADKYSNINLIGVRDVGGNQNGVISFWNNFSTLTRTSYITAINGSASNTDGQLTFGTASSGSLSERMRIDSSGRVLVGLTSANTSGSNFQVSQGVTFPAAQSASSDANTLDDYEEGTWTPTFGLNSGSLTYSNQSGTYTKVGRQVTVIFYVVVNVSSSGVSNGNISSLPFTCQSSTYAGASFAYQGAGLFNGYCYMQGLIGAGSTDIQIRGTNSASTAPALVFTGATLTNGTAIAGTLTYFTS